MTADLTNPIFQDEIKARAHFEAIRWPNGPVCSHCGTINAATLVKGKSHRPGMYQCNACREPFTVTTGSVMESSHIPLHKWALAFHLMAASKKGISAHQLHRMLGITYKSAWFMAHRIREAMSDSSGGQLGGAGEIVEVDETYLGQAVENRGQRSKQGGGDKRMVVTLVERNGRARSIHADRMKRDQVARIVRDNLDRKSAMMTDEARLYWKVGREFARHEMVKHAGKEFVRGDAYTNTVEGFFSIFKRGMRGIYQHCGDRHLHRYLAEFDFRYSNRIKLGVDDVERTMRAIKGAEGKRLTYQQSR
ncbi:MAG: putative transposase [Rhodospirillales bacterium]|nr:putative transposase [Rhodospirillales bacterium]